MVVRQQEDMATYIMKWRSCTAKGLEFLLGRYVLPDGCSSHPFSCPPEEQWEDTKWRTVFAV